MGDGELQIDVPLTDVALPTLPEFDAVVLDHELIGLSTHGYFLRFYRPTLPACQRSDDHATEHVGIKSA